MADREQIHAAIAAQETLRGVVADELIDATVAALTAQLEVIDPDGSTDRRRQATVLFADTLRVSQRSPRASIRRSSLG